MSTVMKRSVLALTVLWSLGGHRALAADQELSSCVGDIEHVCAGLEDHLETCLSQRGSTLTPTCREQLGNAMNLMQSPTGPGTCVADVQHLCPNLTASALGSCIVAKQSQFSDACQKYIQSQKQDGD